MYKRLGGVSNSTAETSPFCIFYKDMDGRCIYINQRWSEITGLSIEDALDQGWLNAIYDDDRERVLAVWHTAVADQVAFKCEYRLSGAQGKIVWVIYQALPEIGSDGEIKDYIGTLTDITELKQAFVAQQESTLRERAITQIIQRMRFYAHRSTNWQSVRSCITAG